MSKKSKILIIYTGGTIGSVRYVCNDGKEVKGQPKDILKLYPEAEEYFKSSNAITLLCSRFYNEFPSYKNNVIFDNKLDMEVLSENMTIDKWNDLLKILRDYDFSQYDGVIITHGTDTLAYTANLLAMVFNNISVPMFLVSSNESLDIKEANGVYNFKAAIDFILNEKVPGVYVSYKNGKDTDVFYGSRIVQCKQIVDKFESISDLNLPKLGSINETGKFLLSDRELMQMIKYEKNITLINDENLYLNSNILKISPFVGLDYGNFNIYDCNAIMHTCYHSGTACTVSSRENSILNFIRLCDSMNIDFYYGPIYGTQDKAIYETTYAVMKAGAKIISNISEENAYVKLLLGYSKYNKSEDIMDYIDKDVNKEHIYVRKR